MASLRGASLFCGTCGAAGSLPFLSPLRMQKGTAGRAPVLKPFLLSKRKGFAKRNDRSARALRWPRGAKSFLPLDACPRGQPARSRGCAPFGCPRTVPSLSFRASAARWRALREGGRRKFGAAERQEDLAIGGRFKLHAVAGSFRLPFLYGQRKGNGRRRCAASR